MTILVCKNLVLIAILNQLASWNKGMFMEFLMILSISSDPSAAETGLMIIL